MCVCKPVIDTFVMSTEGNTVYKITKNILSFHNNLNCGSYISITINYRHCQKLSIYFTDLALHQVYCHMESLCNSSGGWMRIANLNMTENGSCPDGFRMYSEGGVHACGRPVNKSGSCVGTIFSSSGIKYSQVCGKVIGYQVGWTDASGDRASNIKNNINTFHVDGVSLTHGNPRKHVWTFMSGQADRNGRNSRCPCGHVGSRPAPLFVGSDYITVSLAIKAILILYYERYIHLIHYGMVKIVVLVKLVVVSILLFLGFISLLVIILLIILR